MEFDRKSYTDKLEAIFVRYPSVQTAGFNGAYKPGLEHMQEFDRLLGSPSRRFRSIHIAGTNGKGSVANMLASAISATGLRVGLYTSPHITDFRERMRIIDGRARCDKAELISEKEVWDFICRHEGDFEKLDLSFFEITTGMAFDWFATKEVDYAVIETGLGGRLDSTNILIPELSVVTSIGLDHCAILGDSLELIAREKAGIFKQGIPAVVGTYDPRTAIVFESVAANLSCPLTYADRASGTAEPVSLPSIKSFDLQGEYQSENLRTVLRALDILGIEPDFHALAHTASRMNFHGRWEKIHNHTDVICDIGHNPPALKKNFAQLESLLERGTYRRLIIVYGIMKDKDLDGILPLMPPQAKYMMVSPDSPRAMGSAELTARCSAQLTSSQLRDCESVAKGIKQALSEASCDPDGTLVYIGGSTFVVSEAVKFFEGL